MGTGPQSAYEALLAAEELTPDADQAAATARLQALHDALAGYPVIKPSSKGLGSALKKLLGNTRPDAPKSVYLYGGVGRGKSMVMDLFFEQAPTPNKRRVHFHEFMLDVHARLKTWRKASMEEMKAAGFKTDDPIPPVAREVAMESTLLCFDEMQVTDIADAMVLGRLFGKLFEQGVVVVATSNRHPDDLYKNGLNRQLFLPTIELFKDQFDVLELNGATDYRLERMKGLETYYTPVDEASTAALTDAFYRLTDRDVADKSLVPSDTVEVMGRVIDVPRAVKGVAVFSFKRLCANPLGAADYLAIARKYHTIIMVAVPQLTKDKRNEAKRFVTFIDALYENNVKFLCSAAVPADQLYPAGDGSFEFERTVSRLHEMQSADYMAKGHGVVSTAKK